MNDTGFASNRISVDVIHIDEYKGAFGRECNYSYSESCAAVYRASFREAYIADSEFGVGVQACAAQLISATSELAKCFPLRMYS